jgi:hypothetical protein
VRQAVTQALMEALVQMGVQVGPGVGIRAAGRGDGCAGGAWGGQQGTRKGGWGVQVGPGVGSRAPEGRMGVQAILLITPPWCPPSLSLTPPPLCPPPPGGCLQVVHASINTFPGCIHVMLSLVVPAPAPGSAGSLRAAGQAAQQAGAAVAAADATLTTLDRLLMQQLRPQLAARDMAASYRLPSCVEAAMPAADCPAGASTGDASAGAGGGRASAPMHAAAWRLMAAEEQPWVEPAVFSIMPAPHAIAAEPDADLAALLEPAMAPAAAPAPAAAVTIRLPQQWRGVLLEALAQGSLLRVVLQGEALAQRSWLGLCCKVRRWPRGPCSGLCCKVRRWPWVSPLPLARRKVKGAGTGQTLPLTAMLLQLSVAPSALPTVTPCSRWLLPAAVRGARGGPC